MSFRTPNSSFIFERLRRSIKEWAVLRAIFLPAAVDGLVPVDGFLLAVIVDAWGDVVGGFTAGARIGAVVILREMVVSFGAWGSGWSLGFI